MFRHAITVMLITTSCAFAADPALPIKSGTYVRAGQACTDAPFAAIMQFDGKSFSGPHEGNCKTVITSHAGRSYKLRTTCSSLGDGSLTKPTTEAASVKVRSPSRFIFRHQPGTGKTDQAEFRLCASKQ